MRACSYFVELKTSRNNRYSMMKWQEIARHMADLGVYGCATARLARRSDLIGCQKQSVGTKNANSGTQMYWQKGL